MKKTAISFLAQYSEGTFLGNKEVFVTGVKIDSREIFPGDLFVAVKGPTFDGNNYAISAYEKGARSFLLSNEEEAKKLLNLHPDAAVILALDTQSSFEKMAEAYLNQFSLIKVAITGSTGKTSTKALTAAVLASKYKTVCSQRNYNTHLGISLTSFLADENTEAIVFEMGMDTPNELYEYCKWVRPQIAAITNVGTVHMERIGSKEGIANEKLKITSFFNEENTLIYNCDSPFLNEAEIRKRTKNKFKLYPIGEGKEAQLKLSNAKETSLGISFDLENQHFELPILGLHNAHNASLACAIGLHFGISLEKASKALPFAQMEEKRLQLFKLKKGTLLDDSYNANPDSMAAALKTLSIMPGKRKIAAISAMLELGSAEEESHLAIGKLFSELNLDVLLAIGKNREYYAKGTLDKEKTLLFETWQEALIFLKDFLKEGDVLLVKGSLSTNINKLAAELRK